MINVTKTYLPPLEEYQTYLEKIWESIWLTNRGQFVKDLESKLAFQKEWHKEKSYQIFDNSFRLSWINHIEKLYPILRAVSTQRMNQLQTQMRDANFTMQNYAKEIILTQARKGVYENVKTNRLGNLVAYRDLHHLALAQNYRSFSRGSFPTFTLLACLTRIGFCHFSNANFV